MFRKKDISEEAQFALKYAQDHHDCIEWTALNAFRIWYIRPTTEGPGTLTSIEFVIKELNHG
jgi:hypothetical protein